MAPLRCHAYPGFGNDRPPQELSNDSSKRQRLDSLALLLAAKRANTLAVMAQMGSDVRQSFYDDKVKALRSGRDSVVIHPRRTPPPPAITGKRCIR